MPSNLTQTLLEQDDQCNLPLPQFDNSGMFKSYLQPQTDIKSLVNQQSTTCTTNTYFSSNNLDSHPLKQPGSTSTTKDFEYLKMMNTTSLKDPILQEFLEKAQQMEQVAGKAREA